MDCCENTKQRNEENMKGGKSMVEISKKTMLWIVIGVLVIATIFLTIKASTIGTAPAQTTANAVKTAATTASSGMIGGC